MPNRSLTSVQGVPGIGGAEWFDGADSAGGGAEAFEGGGYGTVLSDVPGRERGGECPRRVPNHQPPPPHADALTRE